VNPGNCRSDAARSGHYIAEPSSDRWWIENKCWSLGDCSSMTRIAPDAASTIGTQGPQSNRPSFPGTFGSSPKPNLRLFGSEALGAVLLSGVAGYVDTASFLALFGLFTAHITGDLVSAGTAFTDRLKLGSGTRLVMIPIFIASVAATTLFARVMRRKGNTTLAPMLALMTAALGIFCVTGVTLKPLANEPDAWAVVLIGGAGVVAMGIQNTLMRNALSSYSPTTIMTGNLTQCTIDLIEFLFPFIENRTQGRALARRSAVQRLKRFGFPLLGFMVGAVQGAWFTRVVGLASIAVPTLVVGALTLESWICSTKAQADRRLIKLTAAPLSPPIRPCRCTSAHCAGATHEAKASMTRIVVSEHTTREASPARSGTYRQVRPNE
jgi:uncharacterized membrane protein YoaK (UPF0700 family)